MAADVMVPPLVVEKAEGAEAVAGLPSTLPGVELNIEVGAAPAVLAAMEVPNKFVGAPLKADPAWAAELAVRAGAPNRDVPVEAGVLVAPPKSDGAAEVAPNPNPPDVPGGLDIGCAPPRENPDEGAPGTEAVIEAGMVPKDRGLPVPGIEVGLAEVAAGVLKEKPPVGVTEAPPELNPLLAPGVENI